MGIAIVSYVHAVAWIAADKNFFPPQELSHDIKVMGGSAATMRALLSDNIDIGIAGGDAVIKANLAGADFVVVGGLVNRFYHRIIARPEIKTSLDLRGKKVGLAFLGGPQDMAVKYALKDMGLTYGKDVEILNLGKEFNRMAALSRGDIHATTSQTPPSRLKELGFSVLADLPAKDVAFPYAMIVVRKSYLAKNPTKVRAALRGLCEATTFYQTHEKDSLAIISKHLKGSDTESAAQERYRTGGPSAISYPPKPDPRGFLRVIQALDTPGAKNLKVENLLDLSILEALQKEGHCTSNKAP